jgi:hypothetical protein
MQTFGREGSESRPRGDEPHDAGHGEAGLQPPREQRRGYGLVAVILIALLVAVVLLFIL